MTQHQPPAVGWTLLFGVLGVAYILTGFPPMQAVGAIILGFTFILPFLFLQPDHEQGKK